MNIVYIALLNPYFHQLNVYLLNTRGKSLKGQNVVAHRIKEKKKSLSVGSGVYTFSVSCKGSKHLN